MESPQAPRSRRVSVRVKLVGVTVLVAALVAVSQTAVFIFLTGRALQQELEHRARAVALGMATNLALEVFSGDKQGLQKAADEGLASVPDLSAVVIRDKSGASLASAVSGESDAKAGEIPVAGSEGALRHGLGRLQVITVATPVVMRGQKAAADDLGLAVVEATAEPEARQAEEVQVVGSVQVSFDERASADRLRSATLNATLIGLAVLLAGLLAAWALARRLVAPLEKLTLAAAEIALGKLSRVETSDLNDEIGDLARSFQTMTTGLRSMIEDLKVSAGDVEREAAGILATSTQQSAMASQQASAINETSTTVSEIAQTSKQATEHADSVIRIAQKSEDLTRDGQKTVDEAMGGMDKLGEQVRAIAQSITQLSERTLQIGDIIATVKDLAEQSNLLALNASIEAAKAGEHGRGFAVVAMEMRNLAEQSKVAAGEVRAILGEVQKGTRVAVAATEEGSRRAQEAMSLARSAGGAIMGLSEVIRDSSLAARQIANNTRQQTIGVEQIVSAIAELSAAMADSVEGTKQIESVSTNLSQLSKRLTDLVGRYQV